MLCYLYNAIFCFNFVTKIVFSSLLVNLSKKQFYVGQKCSMCVYASSYDCFLDKFTRRLETHFMKQYYYEL